MPRGILGSLIIAIVLFVAVALVLVGMFHYSKYAGNAEPVGWALRQSGHGVVAAVVQAISVIGMFTALIGMMLAGSRLLYSFGRDGLLPSWLAKLNDKHLPNRACYSHCYRCFNWFNVPICFLSSINFSRYINCIYVCIYCNV